MAAPRKKKRGPPFDVTGIDFSVITTALKTGGRMVEQIMNSIQYGSPEVRLLMLEECELIIECRVCRGLFRALPNFIAHKRVYCCEAFSSHSHNSEFQAATSYSPAEEEVVVVEPTAPEEDPNAPPANWSRELGGTRLPRNAKSASLAKTLVGRKAGIGGFSETGKTGCTQAGKVRARVPVESKTRLPPEKKGDENVEKLAMTVKQITEGKLGNSKEYVVLSAAAEKAEREKAEAEKAQLFCFTPIPSNPCAVFVSNHPPAVTASSQARPDVEPSSHADSKQSPTKTASVSLERLPETCKVTEFVKQPVNSKALTASPGKGSASLVSSIGQKTTVNNVYGHKPAIQKSVTCIVQELRQKKDEISGKMQSIGSAQEQAAGDKIWVPTGQRYMPASQVVAKNRMFVDSEQTSSVPPGWQSNNSSRSVSIHSIPDPSPSHLPTLNTVLQLPGSSTEAMHRVSKEEAVDRSRSQSHSRSTSSSRGDSPAVDGGDNLRAVVKRCLTGRTGSWRSPPFKVQDKRSVDSDTVSEAGSWSDRSSFRDRSGSYIFSEAGGSRSEMGETSFADLSQLKGKSSYKEAMDLDKLRCSLCDMMFQSKKSLTYHCQMKHTGQRTIFPCPYCPGVFYYFWGLTRHLTTNHKKHPSDINRMRKSLKARSYKQDVTECLTLLPTPPASSTVAMGGDCIQGVLDTVTQKQWPSIPAKQRPSIPAKKVVAISKSPPDLASIGNCSPPPSVLPPRRRRVEVIKQVVGKSQHSSSLSRKASVSKAMPLRSPSKEDVMTRKILSRALRTTRGRHADCTKAQQDSQETKIEMTSQASSKVPAVTSKEENKTNMEMTSQASSRVLAVTSMEENKAEEKPQAAEQIHQQEGPFSTQEDFKNAPEKKITKLSFDPVTKIVYDEGQSVSESKSAGSLPPAKEVQVNTRMVATANKHDRRDIPEQADSLINTPRQLEEKPQLKDLTPKGIDDLKICPKDNTRMNSNQSTKVGRVKSSVETSASSGSSVSQTPVEVALTTVEVTPTQVEASSRHTIVDIILPTTPVAKLPLQTLTRSRSSTRVVLTAKEAALVKPADIQRSSTQPSAVLTFRPERHSPAIVSQFSGSAQAGSTMAAKKPSLAPAAKTTIQKSQFAARSSNTVVAQVSSSAPATAAPGPLHICPHCQRVFGRKISLDSHAKICSRAKAGPKPQPADKAGKGIQESSKDQKSVKEVSNTRPLPKTVVCPSGSKTPRSSPEDETKTKGRPTGRPATKILAVESNEKGIKTMDKESVFSGSISSSSHKSSGFKNAGSAETPVKEIVTIATRRSERLKEADNCSRTSSSRESSADPEQRDSSKGPVLHMGHVESQSRLSVQNSMVQNVSDTKDLGKAYPSIDSSAEQKAQPPENLLALSRQRLSEQLKVAASSGSDAASASVSSSASLRPQLAAEPTNGSPIKAASWKPVLSVATPSVAVVRKIDTPGATKTHIIVLSGKNATSHTITAADRSHAASTPIANNTAQENSFKQEEISSLVKSLPPRKNSLVKVLEVSTPGQKKSSNKNDQQREENTKTINGQQVVLMAPDKSVKDDTDKSKLIKETQANDLESKRSDTKLKTESSKKAENPPVTLSSQRPQRKRRAPLKIAESLGEKAFGEPSRASSNKKMRLAPNPVPVVKKAARSSNDGLGWLDKDGDTSDEGSLKAMDVELEADAESLVEEIWVVKKPGRPAEQIQKPAKLAERVRSNRIYVVEPSNAGRLTCQDTRKVGQIIDETGLTCLQCDQHFTSVSNLRRHAIRHLGWRRFKCRLCRFCSYNRSECKTHIVRAHPERLRLTGGGGPRIDSLITDLNRQAANVRSLKKRQTLEGRCSLEELQEGEGQELQMASGHHSVRSSQRRLQTDNSEVPQNTRIETASGTAGLSYVQVVAEATQNSSRLKRHVLESSAGTAQRPTFNISTRNSPRKFDTQPYPRPQNSCASSLPLTVGTKAATARTAIQKKEMSDVRSTGKQTATKIIVDLQSGLVIKSNQTNVIPVAAIDKSEKQHSGFSEKEKSSTLALMEVKKALGGAVKKNEKLLESKQGLMAQAKPSDEVLHALAHSLAGGVILPAAAATGHELKMQPALTGQLVSLPEASTSGKDKDAAVLESSAMSSAERVLQLQPEPFSAGLVSDVVVISGNDSDDSSECVDVVVACDYIPSVGFEQAPLLGFAGSVFKSQPNLIEATCANSTEKVLSKKSPLSSTSRGPERDFASGVGRKMIENLQEMETLPENFMSGDVPSPTSEIDL